MEPGGHSAPLPAPAANCTRVQTVRIWLCSRKALCGRRTTIEAGLASPARGRKTAVSAGKRPRLVPPFSLMSSRGLKPRLAQPVAAKEEVAVALVPPLEVSEAVVSL